VSAHDSDGNRVSLTWRAELNSDQNHEAAALALCKKMGWEGRLVGGWTKAGMTYVFVDTPSEIITALESALEFVVAVKAAGQSGKVSPASALPPPFTVEGRIRAALDIARK
jgi:hypothetical protein